MLTDQGLVANVTITPNISKFFRNPKFYFDDLIMASVENPWVVVLSSGWIYAWTGMLDIFIYIFMLNHNSVLRVICPAGNIVISILQLVKFQRYYGGCIHAIVFYVLFIEIVSNSSKYQHPARNGLIIFIP